jgi:hypothetical protein
MNKFLSLFSFYSILSRNFKNILINLILFEITIMVQNRPQYNWGYIAMHIIYNRVFQRFLLASEGVFPLDSRAKKPLLALFLKISVRHFGMVEDTAFNVMAPRSSSTT